MDSKAMSKGKEAVSGVIAINDGVKNLSIDDYVMDEEYLNDAVEKLSKLPILDYDTDEGHPNDRVDKPCKLPILYYDTDEGHPSDAVDKSCKLPTDEECLNTAVDKLCKGVMDYISTGPAANRPYYRKNIRLDPQGSWSSCEKFLAFSSRYKSRFKEFMKEYSRVGIYPKEDVDLNYFNLPDQMCAHEDVLKEYNNFKRFDTVEDFPDHLLSTKHIEEPGQEFAEKIHKEWRTLEEKLPDTETIFVRGCKSKMDLLRAVIIGPNGTPYHDGLFFFDVHIPSSYPTDPPLVRYHSAGFGINPHLFECGEFRLNLGTPAGDAISESFPTTVLGILIFIKDRVLNADPLFQQPGLDSGPLLIAEYFSLLYNENIVLKSLHTLCYIILRPPKNFEAFAVGHFWNRGHDILNACSAYIKGLQAGRVDGNKKMCCSYEFRSNVRWLLVNLRASFEGIEAKISVKSPEVLVLPRQPNSRDSSIVNELRRSRKTTRKLRKKSIRCANPLTNLSAIKNLFQHKASKSSLIKFNKGNHPDQNIVAKNQ